MKLSKAHSVQALKANWTTATVPAVTEGLNDNRDTQAGNERGFQICLR